MKRRPFNQSTFGILIRFLKNTLCVRTFPSKNQISFKSEQFEVLVGKSVAMETATIKSFPNLKFGLSMSFSP